MKHVFLSILLLVALSAVLHAQPKPIFDVTYVHPTPLVNKGHAGTESNAYGFEGGRAIKYLNTYYIFTTEMSGLPIWGKTKLALWKSKDGLKWKRASTLFESSGDFTGADTHAALWSPMPTYDEKSNRWTLTYVAYRSKPNTDESWYRNYDGRIVLATSKVSGMKGLEGPYVEKQIIMQPGNESASWEGLMGVDSFFPYETAKGWMGFYGSSTEVNGLASAPKLSGPWQRISKDKPVSEHTENPIVTQLKDGRYVAFFDGCGVHQKFGYLVSADGERWSAPILIDLDNHPNKWWGLSRTPLGLIDEGNDTFTLYFTAYNKNFYEIPGIWSAKSDSVFDGFYAGIGMLKLKLVNPTESISK